MEKIFIGAWKDKRGISLDDVSLIIKKSRLVNQKISMYSKLLLSHQNVK